MNRILGALLAGLFFIHAADVPFELFKGNSLSHGCCCKDSIVCGCKHGNRICRLNKRRLTPGAEGDVSASPCHSKKPFQLSKTLANKSYSLLNALNCGLPEDKSASSSYPKEFCLISCSGIFLREIPGIFSFSKGRGYCLLLDRRLDRPPRFIASFPS